MLQRPNAIGLFLCEQVVIENKTHNATLVNSLSRLRVRSLPSPPQRLVVYGVLTDGLGEVTMSLVVTRLDDLEDIYKFNWQMRFRDPLQDTRLILRMPELVFPDAIRYQFTLAAANEPIAHCVIQVIEESST
jgi:hypothetical protein